jgi:hypothetical protein
MSYIQNEFLKVQANFKWITYKRKSSAEDIHPESNKADVQAKESLGTRDIYEWIQISSYNLRKE